MEGPEQEQHSCKVIGNEQAKEQRSTAKKAKKTKQDKGTRKSKKRSMAATRVAMQIANKKLKSMMDKNDESSENEDDTDGSDYGVQGNDCFPDEDEDSFISTKKLSRELKELEKFKVKYK